MAEIREAYSEFLSGKRVCIVGGADNFNREKLEAYDIIVSINDHCVRQGLKPDVIYHVIRGPDLFNGLIRLLDTPPRFLWANIRDNEFDSGFSDERQVDEFVREWHRPPSQWVGFFAAGEWEGENPYGSEYEWLNVIHKKYDCKLLTGLIALADIMRYDPEVIMLCGMTMYLDNLRGLPGYRDTHRIWGNIEFLEAAFWDDGRVCLDRPLSDSIEEYRRRLREGEDEDQSKHTNTDPISQFYKDYERGFKEGSESD